MSQVEELGFWEGKTSIRHMVLLLSLTLLVFQQPADSVEVDRLRDRVEQLENRLERQEISKQYFEDVVDNQRWTFGLGLAIATGIFGIIGWGIFEWRAGYIRKRMTDNIDEVREDIRRKSNAATDLIRSRKEEIESLHNDFNDLDDSLKGIESSVEDEIHQLRNHVKDYYGLNARRYFDTKELELLRPVLYALKAVQISNELDLHDLSLNKSRDIAELTLSYRLMEVVDPTIDIDPWEYELSHDVIFSLQRYYEEEDVRYECLTEIFNRIVDIYTGDATQNM